MAQGNGTPNGYDFPQRPERSAIMRVTGRCNQECVFCCQEGLGDWDREPGLDEIKRDLDALHARGVEVLTFMQGESLTRKDFPDIITYARELGFTKIGAATNGTLLSGKKYLDKLIAAGISGFEFSIHSHIEETANLISGRPFTHRRQQAALKNLVHAPVHVFFNTVICHHNRDHLHALADHLADMFSPPRFRMNLKFPFMVGRVSVSTLAALRYEELDLRPLFKLIEERGLDVRFENFPLCFVPGHEHKVMKAVDLVQRHEYVSREGQAEDYRSMGSYTDAYERPPACEPCSLRAICPGIDSRYIERLGAPAVRPSRKSPVDIARRILGD